jgi:hypothetical protein
VSAFAAGCAICGAELDPHRADRRPGTLDRLLDRITSRLRNRAGEARTQRARR